MALLFNGAPRAQTIRATVTSTFFGDMLQSIAERGRSLLDRSHRRGISEQHSANLIQLCEELLSRRGEASGVALAREILARYSELKTGPRIAFFEVLANRFGPDAKRLSAAATAWLNSPTEAAAAKLHRASEPRRLELIRRLNLAPNGTAALVRMREQLIDALDHRDDLELIDTDFLHLFASWFNRGFLVLRRIDWSTPARILEKIIRYEAVHEIRDWNDLRTRIDSPDRRCYAFFHPALTDEPLIFVEVALTRGIPDAIEPLLDPKAPVSDLATADCAIFYSITNCQEGLRGVSFGNFLIKQVAEDLGRAFPRLKTFATLSPVPGFTDWLTTGSDLPNGKRVSYELAAWLEKPTPHEPFEATLSAKLRTEVRRLGAYYLLHAKRGKAPLDQVARFHLANGARLGRLNWMGDTSP